MYIKLKHAFTKIIKDSTSPLFVLTFEADAIFLTLQNGYYLNYMRTLKGS